MIDPRVSHELNIDAIASITTDPPGYLINALVLTVVVILHALMGWFHLRLMGSISIICEIFSCDPGEFPGSLVE